MKVLDIRMETELKRQIKELSGEKKRSISEIARDLLWIGIGAEKAGGLEVSGPLGFSRPLAGPSFGGKEARLSVQVDEELISELKKEFGEELRSAGRKAIRLGAFVAWPEKIEIGGIFKGARPFAEVSKPGVIGEKSKSALRRIKDKE